MNLNNVLIYIYFQIMKAFPKYLKKLLPKVFCELNQFWVVR